MYLLGHIAIGYLVAWGVARWRKQNLSLWLAFTAGIIPDYDILFQNLGLVHHTYTHSLLLWAPVMIALVWWNRKTLPYVGAILSHLLIGDIIVSSVPLLLPISNISFGLRLGMPSATDAILESSFFCLMLLTMLLNGDFQRALNGEKSNFLLLVPLVSMALLTWLAAGKPELGELAAYGFSRQALEAISTGQIILGFLLGSFVLVTGIRQSGITKKLNKKQRNSTK